MQGERRTEGDPVQPVRTRSDRHGVVRQIHRRRPDELHADRRANRREYQGARHDEIVIRK